MMADLRKYGESATILFSLFQVDGVDFEIAATFASGDIKVMRDEGVETTTTNLPTDEGQGYSIVLTAAEMQAARVKLYIVDQTATKVWLDHSVELETYGNVSAQHAFDLNTASTPQTADIADSPTNAEFNARTLAAAAYFDTSTDKVTLAAATHTGAVIPTVSVLTDHTAQTGDSFTRIGAAGAGLTGITSVELAADQAVNAAKIGGQTVSAAAGITVNAEVGASAAAMDNFEDMYDGTGYTDDTAPASRSQVNQIANVGAAINVSVIPSPNGFTLTTGTEVNNEDATVPLDGTRHELTDAAGVLSAIYKFDIGGDAAPVSITFTGVYNSNNDSFIIEGNVGSDASPVWVQIGTLVGTNAASNIVRAFDMFSTMIVSDITGQVQVRVSGTGLTSSSFDTDQVFVSKSSTSRSVGYANGLIWVDTNASNTGTEPFVDGVADNPVSTWAAALTLSASVGIKSFNLAAGSSIALSANSDAYTIFGSGATIAQGGQSIEGAILVGATITGIGVATVTPPTYNLCKIGTATVPPSTRNFCQYLSTMTLGSAGDYFDNDGRSGVAGSGSPTINYNSIGAGSTVNIRAFSGGLNGTNVAATTVSSWEFTNGGTAQVTGTGGEVFIRGQVANTINNSLGVVTMDITGVMNQTTNGVIRTNVAQGPGTGNNQIQLDTGASSVDGAFDPGQIAIISGIGAGQSRLILEYDGTSKTCTVDRNWKTNPDSTSTFLITTNPGREHVNEGLAQAGSTSTTIKLNALASSDDDSYPGQHVFIRSGTGDDQSKLILSYNGTTKVATIDGTWGTTPDATSAYVMLPVTAVLLSIATQASIDAVEADLTTITGADGVVLATLQPNNGLGAIQKNVALNDFELLMVLTSDHVTPAPGLTVTAQRSVDGAAFAAVTGTIAEVSNGVYVFDAATADTNGGLITWKFSAATADDTFFTFKTTT